LSVGLGEQFGEPALGVRELGRFAGASALDGYRRRDQHLERVRDVNQGLDFATEADEALGCVLVVESGQSCLDSGLVLGDRFLGELLVPQDGVLVPGAPGELAEEAPQLPPRAYAVEVVVDADAKLALEVVSDLVAELVEERDQAGDFPGTASLPLPT
jgi:hypothetical protein